MSNEVVIIFIRSEGKFFVCKRRADKKLFPGFYALGAGGKIEPGETPQEAARRELLEETGISAVPIYKGEIEFNSPEVCHKIYYFDLLYDGEIKNYDREWESSEWISEQELLTMMNTGKVCPDTEKAFRLYSVTAIPPLLSNPL